MANYNNGSTVVTFHAGYYATAYCNASGFSYQTASGVSTLSAPTPGTTLTGGQELPITDWASKATAAIVMFKNSKSGKVPLREATFLDDDNITVNADFDFANNPFLAANGGIAAGVTIPWVVLLLNQTVKDKLDGIYIVYSSLIIKTTPVKAVVEGKITWSFDAAVSGPFWLPGQTTC